MTSHRPAAQQQQMRRWRHAPAPFKAVHTAVRKVWIDLCVLFRRVPTDRLENFLIFAGYPRSGSSTLGALLDAHPQMLVAHECNVLKHLLAGYTRSQMFALIERNSRRFAASGRNSTGYKCLVENQYNGRTTQLRVLGDKKAGRTALLLAHDSRLLDRLQATIRLPLKCLHLVRNPFDMITTDAYGGHAKQRQITPEVFDRTCREFFDRFDAMTRLISSKRFDVYTVRYENLLNNPAAELQYLTAWLGVDSEPAWHDACCRHLFRSPHKSRSTYAWSGREIHRVTECIGRCDFLRGYTFED